MKAVWQLASLRKVRFVSIAKRGGQITITTSFQQARMFMTTGLNRTIQWFGITRNLRPGRRSADCALRAESMEARTMLNAAPVAIADMYESSEDTTLNTTSGLVNHWKFDEMTGNVAVDSAGGNHGTLFNWGGGEAKWVAGRLGNALHFGDFDNYVRTKSTTVSDQYSFAFWSRMNGRDGINPRIITPSSDRDEWIVQNNQYGRGIGFYYAAGATDAQVPNAPVLGEWEQYVVAFDRVNSHARIYRDGKLAGEGRVARENPEFVWMIGHNQDAGRATDTWNGAIDDLRIYNRLLIAEEVASLAAGTEFDAGGSVLSNDTDADQDVLHAILVSDVSHGSLTFNSDGTFAYQPAANFHGDDSFQYRANDGIADSEVVTVHITVRPVNDPPVAINDRNYEARIGEVLEVAAANGVLRNDLDPDGQALTAVLVDAPANGSVVLHPDGAFEYVPHASTTLTDQFTYRANDGQNSSNLATVTIKINVPTIEVGNFLVHGDTPGQPIEIFVRGGHRVTGLDFFVQVGDGGPERTQLGLLPGTKGPKIERVQLKTGSIFAGVAANPTDLGSLPQVANWSISLTDNGYVRADGLLATLMVDTTGLFEGQWDLRLTDILPQHPLGPVNTSFAGVPVRITNGSLRIIPAKVVGRYVFYNNSTWDGNNIAADAADDLAVATDKTALLPGQSGSFANYTSYDRGINGVMIDVQGAGNLETLSAADLRFRVGRNNNPSTWAVAPTPQISVRRGAGVNTSDRITLIWPANSIQNQWLEVRLRCNSKTLLASDDVFYFGNAIGETGTEPGNTLVTSIDAIGARNNQRGPLNPAPITDPYDFNRDRLVSMIDVILAQEHQTGLLTALPLIRPVPRADVERVAGDANQDGTFDQLDIVSVLQAAKYLTGQRATWSEGDWNGDGVFDQLDIVAAFQSGNYRKGPYATTCGLVKRNREIDAVDDIFADGMF